MSIEHPAYGNDDREWRRVDAAILVTEPRSFEPAADADVGDPPVVTVGEVVMPEERRETCLVVRERKTMNVVAVIETLSPPNKRPGEGRRESVKNATLC